MPEKCMECFRLLLEHLAWIEYQFLSGIRDSRKAESLWGMMRGVGGVRKSIQQSWLAKGLGLLCWGFKGVQEEIPSEKASTLQWHFQQNNAPVHNSIIVTDYLTKMGIKTVPQPPYSPDLAPCDFWLFPKLRGCRHETIEELKEAVMKVIDTLTQEDFHGAFEKLLEWYNKCIAANRDIGPAVRVFANGPGDLGSIPGRVIPKTLKMELDTTLLNTQHYKVRFKGKVEQSWEWSSALPYTLV